MRNSLERRLSLRQLRAIEAIDKCGSLSQAALQLCVTQPALSKSLHEAEDVLGIRVFDRHSRGMVRTRKGEATVGVARAILAQLRRLEDELDGNELQARETVVVGALPTAALGILPGLLARLSVAEPRLRIRVVEGVTSDLLSRLEAGVVDFVLGRTYEEAISDRFIVEPLYAEPLSVIARAGHPIFAPDPAAAGTMLRDQQVILPVRSEWFSPEMELGAETLDLQTSATLRSGSIGLIRELLYATDLVAVLPSLMLMGDIRRGALQETWTGPIGTERPGGMVTLAGQPLRPSSRLLERHIRAYVRELVDEGRFASRLESSSPTTRRQGQGVDADRTPKLRSAA